jgi:hypothetical protein
LLLLLLLIQARIHVGYFRDYPSPIVLHISMHDSEPFVFCCLLVYFANFLGHG